MDPRPITSPEPEVSKESGVYSVVMPYLGSMYDVRYRADCWSIRIWRNGDDPAFAEEVLFPTAIDPSAVIVRLCNGVLEFLLADTTAVCNAFEESSPLEA